MAAADFRGLSPNLMIADKGGLQAPNISLLWLLLKAARRTGRVAWTLRWPEETVRG